MSCHVLFRKVSLPTTNIDAPKTANAVYCSIFVYLSSKLLAEHNEEGSHHGPCRFPAAGRRLSHPCVGPTLGLKGAHV